MAKHFRRPRWQSVEQVVRLLVSVADGLARLYDSFHHVR